MQTKQFHGILTFDYSMWFDKHIAVLEVSDVLQCRAHVTFHFSISPTKKSASPSFSLCNLCQLLYKTLPLNVFLINNANGSLNSPKIEFRPK